MHDEDNVLKKEIEEEFKFDEERNDRNNVVIMWNDFIRKTKHERNRTILVTHRACSHMHNS